MSIGHKNPKYVGPEMPLNIRQPKSLPTVTNLQQIISVLKAQQTKLNLVLQSPNTPFTPINVQAKGIAGGIEISWQSVPSPGLDGYILFKSVTADFNPVNVTRIPLPHAQLTTYIDAVGGGETFYYALVATAGTTHAPQSVLSAPSAATSATSLASGTDSNLDQIADGVTYVRLGSVNTDHTIHVSSPFNKQGSLVNVGGVNPFSYTATTTSITWNWTSFTIYFLDGTTATINAGSTTISGLTAGTTYYFYSYVTQATLALFIGLVGCGGGTCPGGVNISIAANTDGRIPIIINITAATPASGTGGGSGSGGSVACFSPNTRVHTSRGDIPIAEVRAGDYVLTAKHTWRRVQFVTARDYLGPMYDMGKGELVEPDHRFLIEHKGTWWVAAKDLGLYPAVEYAGTIHNIEVETEEDDDGTDAATEHSYTLTNGWCVHNVLT